MGGGVMRTAAAKTAASWGARRAGSAVGRRTSVPSPPAASAAAAESTPISVQAGESKGLDETAISQWEDDWEFAGWKDGGEELAVEPAPRLVFGPAPTIEEAKEATSDLKYALETAYFSESGENSATKKNELGQNGLFQNNSITPPMPRGVVQAFSLLQSSPEAQSVVASLASDKAVWDAVMKNNKVMEFYRNNQSSLTENIFEDSSNTNPTDNNSDNNTSFEEASKESNGFVDFVTNMKGKAVEVVNNVSNLIQNVFGTKSEEGAHASETGESNGNNKFVDFILTPHNTFLGLAIAVIFIVLLKRP
ncbi:hypothetical protein LUZ60_009133 [Juncus effusus]|nr:hypothetical protein LUZ60_009133 [Juncus effusus]